MDEVARASKTGDPSPGVRLGRRLATKAAAAILWAVVPVVPSLEAGEALAEVVAWGWDSYGATNVPDGLSNVVALAAGQCHSLALTADGRVVGWGAGGPGSTGSGHYGQTDIPVGLTNVVAIAAGGFHSLAVTAEGRVVAWGAYGNGTNAVTAPAGLSNVVAVAAGYSHSVALTAEGLVVSWGAEGWTGGPSGLSNVVGIAAGYSQTLALTADGRVAAWGPDSPYPPDRYMNVPADLTNVVAMAAGGRHNLALTLDGTVVAWGDGIVVNVPAGLSNAVAVASGGFYGMALTAEGHVVSWGLDQGTAVPSSLSNVVGIASGYYHGLALIGRPPGQAAPAWTGPRRLVATANRPFHHRIMAKNGVDAYGVTGLPPGLVLDSNRGVIRGVPSPPGSYAVTVCASNRVGTCGWPMLLLVNEPAAPAMPSGRLIMAGVGCGFRYAVPAYNAPEWYWACGLPAGLRIDAATGVISGVAIAEGDHLVELAAFNDVGMGTGFFSLRVAPVVVWDVEWPGHTTVPASLGNVVALATGYSHTLALQADGRVLNWYHDSIAAIDGWTNVLAIAVGGNQILALTADDRVLHADGVIELSGLSNVVTLAAGDEHALALTGEGRVLAWGSDYHSHGWAGQATVPPGLSNVVSIAAGSYHSLAATADGRVVAWGAGTNESVGNWPDYGQARVPDGLSNVVAVAAGAYHSLALTAEGRVTIWGDNDADGLPGPGSLSNIVAIAAGGRRSLMLTESGQVVASALGSYYPGGPEAVPTTAPGGLSNVVAIAASSRHNLALTGLPSGIAAPGLVGPRLLVATEDQPFHHRILARNGPTTFAVAGLPRGLILDPATGRITGRPLEAGTFPVVVSAANRAGVSSWTVTLFVNRPVPAIASSGFLNASLGLDLRFPVVAYNSPEWYGADGLPAGLAMDPHTGIIAGAPSAVGDFVVSLVASNRHGRGIGSVTLRVSPVVEWPPYGDQRPPGGLSNVVAIAADEGSLALTADGRVRGWRYFPTMVPADLSNVVAIAPGAHHVLALTGEGQIVAWGANEVGQTTVPSGLNHVVAIAARLDHSLALTADGRVVAWGAGTNESMTGWPHFGQSRVPAGLTNAASIAAGFYHSLALTTDGQVVAWGAGTNESGGEFPHYGQSHVPPGLDNVVGIDAGAFHSLALTSDGRIVAWGGNQSGQTDVPSGLTGVVAIAAGSSHNLALTGDGRVVAWGSNGSRESTVPAGLSNVVAIAAGASHSLVLLRQPTVPLPRLRWLRGMSGLELTAEGATGMSGLLLRASSLPGPWWPVQPVTLTNDLQALSPVDFSAPARFFKLFRK